MRRLGSALAPLGLLYLLAGCDVNSTVGFNERGNGLAGGERCATDAPLARCATSTCVVTDLFEPPRIGTTTLGVDRDNVYLVTTEFALAKRALGGGPIVDLASAETPLMRLTLDDTFAYWTEQGGSVRAVPKGGGAMFEAAYVFGNPTEITTDGAHLYWVIPPFGGVAMAPTPGGEAMQISGQSDPQAIAVDSTHVYWVNAGTAGAPSGQLVRAQRGNIASAEVLLTDLDAPTAITVSDDSVYWVAQNSVFRMLKATYAVETVATGFQEIRNIAAFGDILYGAGMDGLWRLPATGGEPELLDRRPMSALALACSGAYATGWFESALARYAP